MIRRLIFLLFACSAILNAQGLFESAVSGRDENENTLGFQLNGFIRGVIYAGKDPHSVKADFKAAYSELDLKLRARKGKGRAFAELRLQKGFIPGHFANEISLREAWASFYTGNLEMRVGRQIIVWGRADGINPTNNITPQNMMIRSPNEDDRREGNMLVRAFYRINPFRAECIWIPVYAPNRMPLGLIDIPDFVQMNDIQMPAPLLNHSGFAVKLHYEKAAVDGSVSWFDGYAPMPGMAGQMQNRELTPVPFRVRVIGADFQTAIRAYGIRGELAWKIPLKSPYAFFPEPFAEWHFVFGIDRTWGNFGFILQVEGKIIPDWKRDMSFSADETFSRMLVNTNRMLTGQQEKIQNSIMLRLKHDFLYETLKAEIPLLLRFATDEWMIRPQLSYDIADALTLSAGAEIYRGPENTLFGLIKHAFSAGFIELKASF